jgi:hypothetical protein
MGIAALRPPHFKPDGDPHDEVQDHRSCFDRTDTCRQPRRHQRQRAGSLSLGHRRRIGIAAGALIGAAAVSNAYATPVYVTGPSCRLVTRYDRFGNARMIQVCNYY